MQGIFELENGGGLFGTRLPSFVILHINIPYIAREFNSRAAKAIWDLDGIVLIYISLLLQLN